MTPTPPLISVAELAARRDQVVVCDVRWALLDAEAGADAFAAGHIPGACFVDLDRDLSATGGGGRHPLPEPAVFASTLGRLGIGTGTEVVAYDDAGGAVAARLWWMLRSVGRENSRLLDGGIQAWVAAGLPLSIEPVIPIPVEPPSPATFTGIAGLGELDGRLLVDVRAPERYRGEFEPIDAKAGHIPGAVNMPMTGNLEDSGHFLSSDRLAARYREVPPDAVVYCGSGVNACHTALAMVVAGKPMPPIYVGSFSEWSSRDLPVATGSEP